MTPGSASAKTEKQNTGEGARAGTAGVAGVRDGNGLEAGLWAGMTRKLLYEKQRLKTNS